MIQDEAELLVATPELFRKRFAIEVRTQNEVLSIDRVAREIDVRDLVSGRRYREKYDVLVLSPGAAAIRSPLPGWGDAVAAFEGWAGDRHSHQAGLTVRQGANGQWIAQSMVDV